MPLLTLRIGVLSFIRRRKRRIITCRHADPTLRWPAAFLQKGNTHSPDVNSRWRLNAPNYRNANTNWDWPMHNSMNERRALMQSKRSKPHGRRRGRAGRKHPPLGGIRLMDLTRIIIWPNPALPHKHIERSV
ncbi:hypothetical protein TcCL_NonESM10229 [Trypanosoma cruzi]|nr:hypothetical protein TcCL_NonESM10229 [Trypanosoma cruzi]